MRAGHGHGHGQGVLAALLLLLFAGSPALPIVSPTSTPDNYSSTKPSEPGADSHHMHEDARHHRRQGYRSLLAEEFTQEPVQLPHGQA